MAKKHARPKPVSGNRYLVFSDLHADNLLPLSVYNEDGLGDRLVDAVEALTRIWRVAEEEGVQAILFLGDLFNRPRVDSMTMTTIGRALYKLQDAFQLPLVLLPGNHDSAGRLTTSSTVDVFGALALPHAIIARDEEPAVWDADPTFCFVAKRYDRPDVAGPNLAAHLASVPDPSKTILLLHHDIKGAKVGSWMTEGLDRDVLKRFRLVLSGHYHQPQVLTPSGERIEPSPEFESVPFGDLDCGTVVYIGAPQQIDFGDVGGARGVWLLETFPTGKVSLEFRQLDGPRFASVDFEHDASYADAVKPLAEPAQVGAKYVRLRVSGPKHALDALDREQYEKTARLALDSVPRAFKWEVDVTAHHKARLALDTHLGIDALIEAYVNSDLVALGELDPEDVLAYGRAVLEDVR